jgi:hypothetical protein
MILITLITSLNFKKFIFIKLILKSFIKSFNIINFLYNINIIIKINADNFKL